MLLSELLESDTRLEDIEVHKTDSDVWQIVGKTHDSRLVNLGSSGNQEESITMALEARKTYM